MKLSLALAGLLLFTVAGQAAPVESEKVARDPQAMALFEQSLAAYRKLNSLRLTMRTEQEYGAAKPFTQREFFEWKRPYFSRWEIVPGTSYAGICNGVESYSKMGPKGSRRRKVSSAARHGQPFADPFSRRFLVGQNPLFYFDVVGSTARLRRLPRARQAGALCDGIEMKERFQFGNQAQTRTKNVWFDAQTHLMRALQINTTRTVAGQRSSSGRAYFFDRVEINPRFPSNRFNLPVVAAQTPIVAEATTPHWNPNLRVGQVPPGVEGTDLRGQKVSLKALKGRVVVIDFWATWCSPCAQQMVAIGRLQKRLNSPDLKVIGVSLDLDGGALKQFVRLEGVTAPQLFDGQATEGAIAKRFGLTAIPFVIVVGKDGTIAAVNPHGPTLERAVQAALKQQSPAKPAMTP